MARGSEHKAVRNLSSSLRPLGLEPVRPLRLTRKTRSGLHKTPGGVFRRAAYGLPGFDFRPARKVDSLSPANCTGGLCGLRRLDRNVPIDAAYAGSLPFFF